MRQADMLERVRMSQGEGPISPWLGDITLNRRVMPISAHIMAEIAAHSKTRGSARHLLLTIASYANPNGRGAYPSMQTLAADTGLSERHIQRVLRSLETSGDLTIDRVHVAGKRPHNRYHIVRYWLDTAQTITDTMSMDPQAKREKNLYARVREEHPKGRDPHFIGIWLGLSSGSDAWRRVVGGP